MPKKTQATVFLPPGCPKLTDGGSVWEEHVQRLKQNAAEKYRQRPQALYAAVGTDGLKAYP